MANKTKKKRKRKLKLEQRERLETERGQKKVIRHNTAVNQEKHRIDWQPITPNEDGMVADRRIMRRDEQDRREGNELVAQQTFKGSLDDAQWQEMAAETPFQLGIVVEVSRSICRVALGDNVIVSDIRGILTAEGTGFTNIVAVGDRVLLRLHADDRGLIEGVLPRRSGLARADSFNKHLKQIIASNVDQVLIVASWRDPHLWYRMIDEYLIGATRNNLEVVICVNKIDLAESVDEVETAVSPYRDLGYHVILASAELQVGIEPLREIVRGRTNVLAGLSGVGKSSLLNALVPGFELRTKHVSIKRHEGRHTTTQALMLPLPFGGYVVDTPGIRDMGVNGMEPDELIEHYPDVSEFAAQCRFGDCTHSHEPKCGVKTAVSNKTLPAWRLKDYNQIYTKLVNGEYS
ncbi:MAG: ribosome small subunit-dependent GTPase A [Chloroflexi bacterium]|nr:MAG: ribosome small subunit-dependent GTPase A [Chloroflexota bacterium]